MQKQTGNLIICFLILLFCTTFIAMEADAAEKISWDRSKKTEIIEGNNQYSAYFSSDGKYSWIYKVSQIKEKNIKELELPNAVSGAAVKKIGYEDIEDSDFLNNLMGIGVEPYHDFDNYNDMPKGIRSVIIPDTVTELCDAVFCGFRDLESIEIPEGVTELPYAMFYRCSNLKKVVLPKELDKIGNDVFAKCSSLKEFSISKGSRKYCCVDKMLLSKDKKSFIMAPAGMKNVSIPSTVKEIVSGAFLGTNVKKVLVPAGVTSIQKGALEGRKLRNVDISPENKTYAKAGSCIYTKKGGKLAVIISTDGKVTLPAQVQVITNKVSTAGKKIRSMVVPKTVKELKKNCFHYGISTQINVTIYFEAATPPKMEKGSFCSYATYFVPEKSQKEYEEYYRETEGLKEDEYGNTVFAGY